MPSLFQIIDEYQQQLAALQDMDLPPEAVMDTIEGMQGDVETKLRAVIAYAMQVKADAATRKEHAKRMAESAKAMEARFDSLMMYAQVGLMNSGLKLPLVCPEFTINLAKNPPSLEVANEEAVPDGFKRRTCTFTVPESWSDERVHGVMAQMVIPRNDYSIDAAVDRRSLLDSVKADPEEHKSYARLAPTSYRLSVR